MDDKIWGPHDTLNLRHYWLHTPLTVPEIATIMRWGDSTVRKYARHLGLPARDARPKLPAPVNPPIATSLRNIVPSPSRYREMLLREADNCGLPHFLVERRTFTAIRARWRVWKVLRDAGASLPSIGKAARVDHSSVHHGLRRLEAENGSAQQDRPN